MTLPARERSESEALRAVAMIVSSLGAAGGGVVGRAALGEDLGEAPVHHLDLAEGADHHVRGLQVAVDHPPRVGIGDRLGDRLEDRQEAGEVAPRRGRGRRGGRPGSGP